MSKIQMRGHCSCCGNEQAVVKGGMAKHGYTVDFGYFSGVCSGAGKAPMEKGKEVTLELVEVINADIKSMMLKIEGLKNGDIIPKKAKSGDRVVKEVLNSWGEKRKRWVEEMVDYADAPDWAKRDAVSVLVRENEYRIRQGEALVNHLLKVLELVYGKALVEIDMTPKAVEVVRVGEVRKLENGREVKVVSVEGRRIYWVGIESGRKSWTGAGAFKKLEKV